MSGAIVLPWPAPLVIFDAGTRVCVLASDEHGTVRSNAGHFHLVDLDDGTPIVALTGSIARARPHPGWKPVAVAKKERR